MYKQCVYTTPLALLPSKGPGTRLGVREIEQYQKEGVQVRLRKGLGLGTMLPVPYLNLNVHPSLETITLSTTCMNLNIIR